jgi:hypothetical protein
VEAYHAAYASRISAELAAALRSQPQVAGQAAASLVSQNLQNEGLDIAVYSPPPSQCQSTYEPTGSRFYVSITEAAIKWYSGTAPSMPTSLLNAIWPLPVDRLRVGRVRGLGWALAPPGQNPQQLHADIWGAPAHRHPDRTRFPHILWKPGFETSCTTEVVVRCHSSRSAACPSACVHIT